MRLIMLLIFSMLSFNSFAFNFSKAGTVWASNCDSGISVHSFAKTASGELGYFIFAARGIQVNIQLTKFVENGNQITFSYINHSRNGELSSAVVSLADGNFRYLERITDGVNMGTSTMMKCSSSSAAYKVVFPAPQAAPTPPPRAPYPPQNNQRSNEDIEYQRFKERMARCDAYIETIRQQCATAGDIGQCMEIKGQGKIYFNKDIRNWMCR